MTIEEILNQAKETWKWQDKLTLSKMIIVLWKVFWDICRWERNAPKDIKTHTDDDLKKELWNLIYCSIRFCDELGYDPEDCIRIAMDCQNKFDKTWYLNN
ncbi:MAG: hypothetical protein ACD_4C00321G0005 [uncultured bacterium (gcode 4)]|uniref:MazG nucleotide pyrophosphohydrolase n=1 Tax=uncultured bacterium (gcode 4) TaxID=1234023 RepID=K2FTT4_9BACT|nr:MAG: hypothetical protein ACD_4C00321G0005 [uncultured bacterium (gcode 4)]